MPFSRRDLLKMGLMAGPGLSLARLAEAQVNDPGSPPVLAFKRPLFIPPQATETGGNPAEDNYEIRMKLGTADIIPGRPSPIWGYADGSGAATYPGPTIRATSGKTTVVRFRNDLPEEMSVHLHGAHVAPDSDGHPNDLIPSGGFKDYTYPNTVPTYRANQAAATLWYHDHAVDVTGHHVYQGLAAFYLITDPVEIGYALPSGADEVPLIIQDKMFNRDGSFYYPTTDESIFRGVVGDRILVNGVIQPFLQVPRRKMRFRIVNGSNARIYDLALVRGDAGTAPPLTQIGSDGGFLAAPVNRTSIRLGPAERADIIIDFNLVPLGTQIYLRNTNRILPLRLDRAPRNIMRFDVTIDSAPSPALPTFLPVVPLGTETRTRPDFVLSRVTQNGRTNWFINNQLFDPENNPPMANPSDGDIEIWRFVNSSPEWHPMHIHLVQFQTLDINGTAPPPGENGWKDTVLVPPLGGNVRVKAAFGGFTGKYVFHCHVLEHEDHAMMAEFEVTP